MKKIFIAGHKGMVGSAILRKLKNKSNKIVIADKKKLNLLNQKSVLSFFKKNKFNEVYLCAAKVGGIHANNTYLADFIYQNLEIQSNLIHSAYLTKVKKLMFLGSSCVYPKKPTDYVIGTGRTYTIKEFVNKASKKMGFKIKWVGKGINEKGIDKKTGKTIVKVGKRYFRPTEVDTLLGDARKARKILKWKPKITFNQMVKEMVESDYKEQKKLIS